MRGFIQKVGKIISGIELIRDVLPLKIKERVNLIKVIGIPAVGGLSSGVAERGKKFTSNTKRK